MIRTDALPKHADPRPLDPGADRRDTRSTVCPGTHCLGRARPVQHRHTVLAVHYLDRASHAAFGGR